MLYSLQNDKSQTFLPGPEQQNCVVINSTSISVNKSVLISKLYHFELSEMTQVSIGGSKFKIDIEWYKPFGSVKEIGKQFELLSISEVIDCR